MTNSDNKLSSILRKAAEKAEELKKKAAKEKIEKEALARKKAAAIEKKKNNDAQKIKQEILTLFDMLWENGHEVIYVMEMSDQYEYLESIGFSLEHPTTQDGERIERASNALINNLHQIDYAIKHGALKYKIEFDAKKIIYMNLQSIINELTSLRNNLQKRISTIEITAKQHQSKAAEVATEGIRHAQEKIEKYNYILNKFGSRSELIELLNINVFNTEYLKLYRSIDNSTISTGEKYRLKKRAALKTARKINPALLELNDDDIIDIINILNNESLESGYKQKLKEAERRKHSTTLDIDSIAIKLGLNDELVSCDELLKLVIDSLISSDKLNSEISRFNLFNFKPAEKRTYENILKFPPVGYYSTKKFAILGDRTIDINLILKDIHMIMHRGLGNTKEKLSQILLYYANSGAKSVKVTLSDSTLYFGDRKRSILDFSISHLLLTHIFELEGLQVIKKSEDIFLISW